MEIEAREDNSNISDISEVALKLVPYYYNRIYQEKMSDDTDFKQVY